MRYLVAIFLLIILWFFAGSFINEKKNTASFGLRQLVLWPRWWVRGLIRPAQINKELNDLKLENENLKARLFGLTIEKSAVPVDFIGARVYASHPFNDFSLITINKGSNHGIKPNMIATVGGNILLGRVKKVNNNYSLIKTIHSPDMEIPVRLGEIGAEALLKGGTDLKVTLIVADQKITAGAIVYAASPDFPYGIKIGELQTIRPEEASVFQEAGLLTPYNLTTLTEVWLQK